MAEWAACLPNTKIKINDKMSIEETLKNIQTQDYVELSIRTRCWKDEVGYIIGIDEKRIKLARKKIFYSSDDGVVHKYKDIKSYPLKKILSIRKLETGEEYKLRELDEC